MSVTATCLPFLAPCCLITLGKAASTNYIFFGLTQLVLIQWNPYYYQFIPNDHETFPKASSSHMKTSHLVKYSCILLHETLHIRHMTGNHHMKTSVMLILILLKHFYHHFLPIWHPPKGHTCNETLLMAGCYTINSCPMKPSLRLVLISWKLPSR